MIRRFEREGTVWVDIENPSGDDVEAVMQEFHLPAELGKELLSPTEKPRVDRYPNAVYAVFHFPATRHTHEKDMSYELDVTLGAGFLITTHYRPMDAVDDLARSLEAAILLKRTDSLTAPFLFLELAERLYRASEGELDALEAEVIRIEGELFSGRERQMVGAISRASRELLTHKRILGNHADTLAALEGAAGPVLGESGKECVRGVDKLYARASRRALAMSDIVDELRDTNTALLGTRQNEIMKNLTIITATMLPLSLLANIFSMNTRVLPIAGAQQDFWIIILIMVAVTVAFALYFKLKKWF